MCLKPCWSFAFVGLYYLYKQVNDIAKPKYSHCRHTRYLCTHLLYTRIIRRHTGAIERACHVSMQAGTRSTCGVYHAHIKARHVHASLFLARGVAVVRRQIEVTVAKTPFLLHHEAEASDRSLHELAPSATFRYAAGHTGKLS